MNKLIDIILPIHNTNIKFVTRALKSIADQTCLNECNVNIILDKCHNGYKEKIIKIINDLQIDYTLFEVEFKNLTDSLIYACSKTKLDYIARIDSDDWWVSNKLELQLEFIKRYNYDLVSSCYKTFSDKNEIVNQSLVSGIVGIKELSVSNPICHSAVLFKRSVYDDLGGYDRNFRTTQDYDLWSKMCLSNYKLFIVNRILTLRGYSNNSISQMRRLDQKRNTLKIRLRFFKHCFKSPSFLLHLILNILSIFKHKIYEIFK